MERKVGKFSFAIPEGHPEAGIKVEKAFEYDVTTTDEEAAKLLTHSSDGKARVKPWSLKDMVNEVQKTNARSSAYQAALLPYRPSEVPQEDIVERMVRDYIRLGFSEEIARKQVTSMLQSKAESEAAIPQPAD